ncbi:DEAD/DEAH box helicase OS=Streptomyces rimosus subsp. rimosus (strain ATCC / DSM 40260 / JCM 4667 / NRRL 2234) OX=1265868 GN=SRIM_035965 PE=4 SV=1 [Streptomyces rimosus subsp. rimosus]
MVTEGTVEDRIAGMLARKQRLADAVLGSGEAALTELTDAELADLVALRGSER